MAHQTGVDLRLNTGWVRHLKTRKLIRKLGHRGAFALLELWSYAAENHPDGILEGMDPPEIEDAAGWDGDEGAFHQALLPKPHGCGWLEADGITLHDWDEHQEWLMGASARSEAAKVGARAKWMRKAGLDPANPEHVKRWERQRRRRTSGAQSTPQSDPHSGPQEEPHSEPQETPSAPDAPSPSPNPSPEPPPPPADSEPLQEEEEDVDLDLIQSLQAAIRWHGAASLLGVVVTDLKAAGVDLGWLREWLELPETVTRLVGMMPLDARNLILQEGRQRPDATPEPPVCAACLAHGGVADRRTKARAIYYAHVGPGTDSPSDCGVALCIPHRNAYADGALAARDAGEPFDHLIPGPDWNPDPLPPPPTDPEGNHA